MSQKVYTVYNLDQQWMVHVASTLEKARQFFVEYRCKPYFEVNQEELADFDFDVLHPETDEQFKKLYEFFEDMKIEEWNVDDQEQSYDDECVTPVKSELQRPGSICRTAFDGSANQYGQR